MNNELYIMVMESLSYQNTFNGNIFPLFLLQETQNHIKMNFMSIYVVEERGGEERREKNGLSGVFLKKFCLQDLSYC